MISDMSKTESIEYWISIFETCYSEQSHIFKNFGPIFLCKSLHSDEKKILIHGCSVCLFIFY